MKAYCRAYLLRSLKVFPGWESAALPAAAELADEDVVYLWDDLSVVRDPVLSDQRILWREDTSEWREFCVSELAFTVPEDLSNRM